jgi:hypothetical protein
MPKTEEPIQQVVVPAGEYPIQVVKVFGVQILVEISAGAYKGQRFYIRCPFNKITIRYPRPDYPIVEGLLRPGVSNSNKPSPVS